MGKRNFPIFSLVMFVLSALLAAYAVWAFYHSYRYISEAAAAGQLVASGNEFDIANFYMSNSFQYVIFAVLLFSAGWLARRGPTTIRQGQDPRAAGSPSPSNRRKDEDEQLDEWFEELRKNG